MRKRENQRETTERERGRMRHLASIRLRNDGSTTSQGVLQSIRLTFPAPLLFAIPAPLTPPAKTCSEGGGLCCNCGTPTNPMGVHPASIPTHDDGAAAHISAHNAARYAMLLPLDRAFSGAVWLEPGVLPVGKDKGCLRLCGHDSDAVGGMARATVSGEAGQDFASYSPSKHLLRAPFLPQPCVSRLPLRPTASTLNLPN